MALHRTNIPGYSKDPKTGLVALTDNTKISIMKEQRRQYKDKKNLEIKIQELEYRIQRLEGMITR